uniref:Uncharacterized protein n=1 Tax=Branchiostoma floridae TaxID=7739 RepID=C3Z6S8_BRAFL|eukprot:XP_002595512.1 hypothetical protein BRAFLDRAFT_69082 [Branchiostoma floridae]
MSTNSNKLTWEEPVAMEVNDGDSFEQRLDKVVVALGRLTLSATKRKRTTPDDEDIQPPTKKRRLAIRAWSSATAPKRGEVSIHIKRCSCRDSYDNPNVELKFFTAVRTSQVCTDSLTINPLIPEEQRSRLSVAGEAFARRTAK